MTGEALDARHPNRVWLWGSLAALGATILAYDIVTDDSGNAMYHTTGGMNRDGVSRFLDQLGNGRWDPEDPNDFKKIIRLVMALGISISTIAALLGSRPDEVDGWAQGQAPKNLHPWTIVSILRRILKKLR